MVRCALCLEGVGSRLSEGNVAIGGLARPSCRGMCGRLMVLTARLETAAVLT